MVILFFFLSAVLTYGQQSAYVPLSDGEKVRRAAANVVRPGALLPVALGIAMAQGKDKPEEWGQDFSGFGQRAGYGVGRLAVRNTFNLAGHMALGTDPRYDRCLCKGFMPRARHAVRRTFIIRTDSGGERFHFGNFASAYATNVVANQWLPDRYHTQRRYLKGTASSIGINVGWNVLREFVFKRDD